MKPKRFLLPVVALALVGAAAVAALAAASGVPGRSAAPATSKTRPAAKMTRHRLRHVDPAVVRRLRSATWRWQAVMGLRRAQSVAALRTPRALRYWRRQARRTRWLAVHPPHKAALLCIHRLEGSWADSGDPYWGGLQMDRSFMQTYAPAVLLRRGWANRWTPLEQLWVAERALRSGRGYSPWPNTARYCGLL
ncbi:MAG TPA: hypothetical protein VLD16_07970 [Gaiellaceae bacterium]|nr:hypothetical protein [Gaiellaceae bacterium]